MKRLGTFTLIRSMRGAMLKYMPFMITCKQFEDFVIDYLEGELPERQRSLFELHMKICRECREYLAAYKRMVEVAQGLAIDADAGEPLPDLPEKLVEAVIAARKAKG